MKSAANPTIESGLHSNRNQTQYNTNPNAPITDRTHSDKIILSEVPSVK